jgi:hypothetical protein
VLCDFGREHVVEGEELVFAYGHLVGFVRDANAWLVLVQLLSLIEWSYLFWLLDFFK